jgi:hypothetical protein
VAADWAYAAHLGREGVRPIGAVVETEPESLDGRFRGSLQMHVVRVRHYADVRKRIPYPF